jgi:hypothetical protein
MPRWASQYPAAPTSAAPGKRENPGVHNSPCPDPSYRVPAARRFAANVSDDTGLEVLDLDTHPEFAAQRLHTRDLTLQMEGLRRLTHSFVRSPDTILQELVNAAVDLCGADSAGISLEPEEKTDANYYHWVATAGQYNGFLNAVLPRYPSACGICLERGKSQLFRVRQRFFDIMGIEAPRS